jgi:hypothetical protein
LERKLAEKDEKIKNLEKELNVLKVSLESLFGTFDAFDFRFNKMLSIHQHDSMPPVLRSRKFSRTTFWIRKPTPTRRRTT